MKVRNILAYRVNEKVGKDPKVDTEVEQEEPDTQTQHDEAHQYNERVEGEVPDANLEPQGPQMEEHKGYGNEHSNEEEEGQLATGFGDVPGVEALLIAFTMLRASWHEELRPFLLGFFFLPRVLLHRDEQLVVNEELAEFDRVFDVLDLRDGLDLLEELDDLSLVLHYDFVEIITYRTLDN